jgi:hypothetical protein
MPEFLGWTDIRWGMAEDAFVQAMVGRLAAVTPARRIPHAPFRSSLELGTDQFDVVPEFCCEGGVLTEVLVRADDAQPGRVGRLRDVLTKSYGATVAHAGKRVWCAGATVIELHTAATPPATWLRCYPTPSAILPEATW